MNPILESISNSISISALPAANALAQPVAGQRGTGGFASTLAAAQGLSTASLGSSEPSSTERSSTGPSTEPVPDGSTAGSIAASNVVARATVNLQPRKPLSAASSTITNNNVAPVPVVLAANQVAWSGSQTSLAGAASLQNNGAAEESVPALPGLATPEPALNESVGSVAKPAPTDALLGNAQPLVVFPASAPPDSAAISSSSSAASGSQPNHSKNELGATEPTAVTGNSQLSELSFISTSTSELPSAGAVWNASSDIPGNGARFAGATAPPVLLASALPEAGSFAGAQSLLNANLQAAQDQVAQDQLAQDRVAQDQVAQELPVQVQTAPENDSPAVAASSEPQSNVPPPVEIGNLLSAMAGAPAAASSVVSSQVPPLSQSALRPVAGRVTAPALASVRGPSASSVSTSALATEPAAGNGSPGTGSQIASQSPFSVFFPSPSSSLGPGTEAAASALPKMILPAASTASRTGITANSVGAAANSQSAGLQSNAVQPAAQPIASQATKDSLSASASGSSQAGPLLHAESTMAAPSVAIAQAAAALTSAPVAGIAAAQAATVPLPQPSVPPGAGAAGPASSVPAAPQALPTAALGPVQMAQMVDRVGQSEMRVGMNTSAFGNVEVRTVVHASDVGLTIGSEKGDLRAMLANDMPAIANNLQQQNLRLSSVSYSQGFSFSNQSSGGGDGQQRSFVPAPAAANYGSPEALAADAPEVAPLGGFGGAGNSLSILA